MGHNLDAHNQKKWRIPRKMPKLWNNRVRASLPFPTSGILDFRDGKVQPMTTREWGRLHHRGCGVS